MAMTRTRVQYMLLYAMIGYFLQDAPWAVDLTRDVRDRASKAAPGLGAIAFSRVSPFSLFVSLSFSISPCVLKRNELSAWKHFAACSSPLGAACVGAVFISLEQKQIARNWPLLKGKKCMIWALRK